MIERISTRLGTPETSLTLPTALHIAENRRRRATLVVLAERSPITLRDLTDIVTESEGVSVTSQDDYKAVYVSLYQAHLPKLADHNVIHWNGNSGHPITKGSEFDAILALVEDARTRFPEDEGDLKPFEGVNTVEHPSPDRSYQRALERASEDPD